ncbi:hypothetical protein ASPBRDRAFT_421503 [Aspergillus brasiliensis CBS 101740]|uniref:Uncharacterized protein n=1 Tax=Aspergillus brasiliensis (strain CBS 101740 / IMI 381727 / IBT 21946) TaxID=767769 RepID=A0A1L9U4M3_ASPBC|nr:hypothetical protein ASPBRDRAFT_421503 [Aspergillus brasiliensis CBS 101740]
MKPPLGASTSPSIPFFLSPSPSFSSPLPPSIFLPHHHHHPHPHYHLHHHRPILTTGVCHQRLTSTASLFSPARLSPLSDRVSPPPTTTTTPIHSVSFHPTNQSLNTHATIVT